MDSFSNLSGPARDGQDHPRPGRAEPGRWPMLESALAAVNRDLTATLPDREPLILMVDPPRQAVSPDQDDRGQVYVAMPDGRWHGDAVDAWDAEEGAPAEPYDEATVLTAVADAAQSTIMELLRQVWPVCREHKIGMHLRRTRTADDRCPEETAAPGPPVWWCPGRRDDSGHDVSPVGELAATLPGKQRRALRHSERRRNGRR
ncbi:hypothetical protein ACFV20_13305 [Streptomyces sp. NPDC059696]|uniref:hypothetical protein n=1 Tax=Streptomyces sp. NPDC059696 TaxID=3346911 RepID=UPI00367EB2CB